MKRPLLKSMNALKHFALASFLLLIAIDTLPSWGLVHDRLKETVDPVLDISGLWQGSWQLFAPSVDSMNTRISALIHLQNGTRLYWRSPDWRSLSKAEQFLRFREAEYYDNLRLSHNRMAARSFAAFLAKEATHQFDQKVAHVEVYTEWVTIPHPKKVSFLPYTSSLLLDRRNRIAVWERK